MAETTQTQSLNAADENTNHKRESDSHDHDSVPKKLKTSDLGVEKVDANLELKACEEEKEKEQKEKEEVELSTVVIDADAAEDKGSRHTMEDAWVVLPDASLGALGKLRCAHFAIYDGHRGRLAADYAKKHLHTNVLSAGLPRELMDVKAAKKAIIDGFRRTDESLLQESTAGGWQDGATAVCIWVLGRTVFVANIGDAKAVVARSCVSDGSKSHFDIAAQLKAIVLTREHKAIYPQERARILKSGGFVTNGRLQGRLEVSRAFGDLQFKKIGVSATPDIHSFDLTKREHFIILGCDGLWGVFGPSDAIEFVQTQLKVSIFMNTITEIDSPKLRISAGPLVLKAPTLSFTTALLS